MIFTNTKSIKVKIVVILFLVYITCFIAKSLKNYNSATNVRHTSLKIQSYPVIFLCGNSVLMVDYILLYIPKIWLDVFFKPL